MIRKINYLLVLKKPKITSHCLQLQLIMQKTLQKKHDVANVDYQEHGKKHPVKQVYKVT